MKFSVMKEPKTVFFLQEERPPVAAAVEASNGFLKYLKFYIDKIAPPLCIAFASAP